jgi:hypothetical protein
VICICQQKDPGIKYAIWTKYFRLHWEYSPPSHSLSLLNTQLGEGKIDRLEFHLIFESIKYFEMLLYFVPFYIASGCIKL